MPEAGTIMYHKTNSEQPIMVFEITNPAERGIVGCHWIDQTGQPQQYKFHISELVKERPRKEVKVY